MRTAEGRRHTYQDEPRLTSSPERRVTVKVLPTFHGSRGKLEAPLKAVLAWCADPDAPDHLPVSLALEQVQDAEHAVAALASVPSRCPRTAKRGRRMLWSL